MAYSNPSVADFKAYFSRDFPYGEDPETQVTDSDIAYAFVQTNNNIPQSLFLSQSSYTLGYELLAAHYLVLRLRAGSQGINGQFNFMEQSKSVGSVSQAFSIPQQFLDNPYWALFTKTSYGMQYLESVMPLLVGNIVVVPGSTRP